MEQREEDAKVALGSHPELDDRHTLERSLYLRHATNHTEPPKQGKRKTQRSQPLTKEDDEGGTHQKLLVGEAKLHAKQDDEVEGHPRERGIETHLHILAHHCPLADDLIHRAKVHAVGKLETEGQYYI